MKLIPEWKDHSYCLMAWPCNLDLYGSQINKAKIEIANLANQISEEEKVYIYCNSSDYSQCATLISNNSISIIETKLDDSWMRDIAPIFYKEKNSLNAISFNFNGYGKYPGFKNDNKVSEFICSQLNIPYFKNNLTLEGGAIAYDDKGNLFTTESVLLNPNRKNQSKTLIEQQLIKLFDLNKIIWIPEGLQGDDTDGHIDNVFCPIGNDKYLITYTKQDDSRNFSVLEKSKKILEDELIFQNPKNQIIKIPLPSEIIINQKKIIASYINFYFTKNSIFVPKFNVKEDDEVYDIFQSVFVDKKIKMVETSYINYGGGNIHCITMNIPKI
jgi:agmatine deiminase